MELPDNMDFHKFGRLIQQDLLSIPNNNGCCSVQKIKTDFLRLNGFCPEKMAKQFGFATFQALLESNEMSQYVVIEQKPSSNSSHPLTIYRGRHLKNSTPIQKEMFESELEKERRQNRQNFWKGEAERNSQRTPHLRAIQLPRQMNGSSWLDKQPTTSGNVQLQQVHSTQQNFRGIPNDEADSEKENGFADFLTEDEDAGQTDVEEQPQIDAFLRWNKPADGQNKTIDNNLNILSTPGHFEADAELAADVLQGITLEEGEKEVANEENKIVAKCALCGKKDQKIERLQKDLRNLSSEMDILLKEMDCQGCQEKLRQQKIMEMHNKIKSQHGMQNGTNDSFVVGEIPPNLPTTSAANNIDADGCNPAQQPDLNSSVPSLISSVLEESQKLTSRFLSFLNKSNDADLQDNTSTILNEFLDFDQEKQNGKQAKVRASGKAMHNFIWQDQWYRRCPNCPEIPTERHFASTVHQPIDDDAQGETESEDEEQTEGEDNNSEVQNYRQGNGRSFAAEANTPAEEGEANNQVQSDEPANGRSFPAEEENVNVLEGDLFLSESSSTSSTNTSRSDAADSEGDVTRDDNYCNLCATPFASPKQLNLHKSRSKKHKERALANGGFEANGLFSCDAPGCSSVLNSPELLRRHKLRAHTAKNFACGQCDKAFAKEWGLTKHRKVTGH